MPALRDTARWVAGEFSAARLTDVNVDDFGVAEPLWIPTEWMVTVRGSGNPDIVLESAFPQRPSSGTDGTLTAPLVFVGTGSSADLANVNVDGKVAVVHKKPDPGLYHSRIDTTEIVARGAVAMIHVIELPGNMHSFDADGCAAAIPCFHVGGEDGFFLEAAIGAAAVAGHPPLEVSLSLGVEERPNATAANAVGTVPGNGRTDENIVINAHADGWFDGASDNADGLAVLVALATTSAPHRACSTATWYSSPARGITHGAETDLLPLWPHIPKSPTEPRSSSISNTWLSSTCRPRCRVHNRDTATSSPISWNSQSRPACRTRRRSLSTCSVGRQRGTE